MTECVELRVVEGPLAGRSWTFDQPDVFLVGRDPSCQVCLPEDDSAVSRLHFVLDVSPPRVRVRDLGSRNGTYLDGRWIGGRGAPEGVDLRVLAREHDVASGTRIRAGATTFEVRVSASPACSRCGAVRPLTRGYCAECLPVITTVPRERPDLSVPRCDQCHRDVRDERPDGASGVYTCQACSGDSAAIRLADLVDRAIARGERYPPEIPGYRRVRRLGVGGAGVAYQAVRIADGRPAALKLLLPGKNSDERARQMFERELQSLWLLRHRNLVEFLQRGLVGQVPWVAMEYCSGGNLEALMKARGGLLKVPEAVAVMLDVLKGLSFMHGRGFVHRDLKPENILLTEDPYRVPIAKVADLGLAHSFEKAGLSGVTVTGLVFGTLRFMPPEQVTRYRWVDPRTDQWAAAATLYYLLTGALTRDFSDTQDPLLTVVFGAIVPLRSRDPSLPVELAAVVDHALDREPAKRFATVAEFAEALRRAVPGS